MIPRLRRFVSQLLLVLLVLLTGAGRSEAAPPDAPTGLVTRAGDRSVVLHWDRAASGVARYRVYRATAPGGPFTSLGVTASTHPHYVDFDVENGQTYHYVVRAEDAVGAESLDSDGAAALPRALTDDEFLDLVAHTAFDYFWYEANPANGLVKDRSTQTSPASIAAVGFGLTALPVGIERGWITREEGRARVLATLRFFQSAPQDGAPDGTGYRGFFYHFLDMQTGRRVWESELSTIDTALLLGGVLFVRAYFDADDPLDAEVRTLADAIYERVDWPWTQVRSSRISHGWKPETGFLGADWGGYNEAMILYVLALGAPTHPVDPFAWRAWTSTYDWQIHYGMTFVVFPPLFGHQYSHVWIDFRGIQDDYMRRRGIDYFENSRRATLANRAYCIENPGGWQDYGENVWGLTASDVPTGYRARGAPPPQNDDGTIAPTAAGGSIAFTPVEALAALRHMYDAYRTQLWGPYGFRDAFNPTQNWFDDDYLGIDQGPILLMIENHRSGFVWDVFMRHEAVRRGLAQAGFEAVDVATEPETPPPRTPVLLGGAPNPFAGQATIRFSVPAAGRATVAVYDVLGRRVATPLDAFVRPGTHAVSLDGAAWPGGVYFYTVRAGAFTGTGTLVLRR